MRKCFENYTYSTFLLIAPYSGDPLKSKQSLDQLGVFTVTGRVRLHRTVAVCAAVRGRSPARVAGRAVAATPQSAAEGIRGIRGVRQGSVGSQRRARDVVWSHIWGGGPLTGKRSSCPGTGR